VERGGDEQSIMWGKKRQGEVMGVVVVVVFGGGGGDGILG